jgi:hypothetical protein
VHTASHEQISTWYGILDFECHADSFLTQTKGNTFNKTAAEFVTFELQLTVMIMETSLMHELAAVSVVTSQ